MPVVANHVFTICIFLCVLAVYAFRYWQVARRPGQMTGLVNELGVAMTSVDDVSAWKCLQRTKLGKTGSRQKVRNAFRSDQDTWGLNLFDFEYKIPYNNKRPICRQTVVAADCGMVSLPRFRMRPEGLLEKAGAILGMQDIDFDDHAAFSRSYFLQSESEADVRFAFQPELLNLFAANPGWTIESRSSGLIFYKPSVLLKPAEMKSALLLCSQAYDLLSQSGPTPETEDYFQELLERNRSHVDALQEA